MSKKKRSPQTIAKLKKTTQDLANRYARLRDCFGKLGTNCISCEKWFLFEELDGGHFIPTTSSAIRFDERNINAQCRRCNRFLHGNPRHYAKGMVRKYGQDVVDDLEANEFKTKKWTREELENVRDHYKAAIKDLESGIPPAKTRQAVSMSTMFS